MNKKFDVSRMIGLIFLIGVISTFITSDIPIGEFFQGLEINGVESLLDTVSIGLGFLAFALFFIFLIFQIGRNEQGDRLLRDWEKDRNEDDDDKTYH